MRKTTRLLNTAYALIDEMAFAAPESLPALTSAYECRFTAYAQAVKTAAAPAAPAITRESGLVASFDVSRDEGLISRPGQSDLFFTARDLFGDITRAPRVGECLSFEVQRGPQILQAVKICNHDLAESVTEFEAWNTPARQASRAESRALYDRMDARMTRKACSAAVVSAPVVVSESADYMDTFYHVPVEDDSAMQQRADVLAVL